MQPNFATMRLFLVIFKHCVISKQQSVIVTAFAWDGKAYKPVGKVGLAILTKEGKPLMVLYKSKQQTLSTLDLSQEHLKVEHQSENVLGTLDMQVTISQCMKITSKVSFFGSKIHIFSEKLGTEINWSLTSI